jgi:PBP1b-binding outer membrane lipoprotein LpoB
MSIFNKEKILTGLREYHTSVFPAKFISKEAADLKTETEALEDTITGMLLKLINGKAEFTDSSEALEKLSKKVTALLPGNKNEEYKNLLLSKIDQLKSLLAMAKDSTFRLRPVRLVKVAN